MIICEIQYDLEMCKFHKIHNMLNDVLEKNYLEVYYEDVEVYNYD